jgi:hypothetical protein
MLGPRHLASTSLCLALFIQVAYAQLGNGGYKGPARTLTFPDDMAVGKVSLLAKDTTAYDYHEARKTPAQGKVLAPVGQPLLLEISYEAAAHPEKLAHIPTDQFEYLKMEKLPIDDTTAAKLVNRFTRLIRLDVKRQDFGDKALELLQPTQNLKALNCQFCSIEGPGMGSLARFKNLRYLWIAYGATQPNKLASMEKLRNIDYLNMRDSKLNDESLSHIAKMVALTGLDIRANPRITDVGVKYLTNLRHLSYLNLTECYKVTVDGIIQLKALPLKSVEVSGRFGETPGMTKEDLQKLQKAFPKTSFRAVNRETPIYKEMLDTLK